MTPISVAIFGHLGALARATGLLLQQQGHRVGLIESTAPREELDRFGPSRLLCFPFTALIPAGKAAQTAADLSAIERLLAWVQDSAVQRIVLRSHAFAYGSSMKNPGLLREDRVSLLPKESRYRRWLLAEELFSKAAGQRPGLAIAILRLTTVLEPGEGDFITALLSGGASAPFAGYDPAVQLLTLNDAARALCLAVLSNDTGVFNIASVGAIPFRRALRVSVPLRLPLGGAMQKIGRSLLWRMGLSKFPAESIEQVRYNWTVSPERADRRLGFVAQSDSVQALKQYLRESGQGRPDLLKDTYDEFGLDPEYLESHKAWFDFLRKIYWRVESEGIENVPAEGPALLVASHRGFMPFDGVMHRSLILEAHRRHIRFLVISSLFKFPFLTPFLIKQGGVVASQENAKKLFDRRELVGIFPEGIGGAFRMYRGAYKLGEMGKDAFARMAIAHGVPIIPAATVGHVEIFPILGRVKSSWVTRTTGWPFLPITPTFPLLPAPLPTKWHIRYADPILPVGLRPEDADNRKLVKEFSLHVQEILQGHIDEMLRRRKHLFFGNIFDRSPRPGANQTVRAPRR